MSDKKIQRKMFGLRMLPEVHDWLLERSEREERSMNWIVSKILEDAMAEAMQEKDHAK
ncbi:MAG: hypothetical protein RBR82_12750 [Pseudomonas sp.]|nr:hypothetical protein [Pseudomonas sp.]